mmetsp:Transcript_17443/g.48954  ORF Transcript_17443/g.48954 Transcript_17443/m.48954 type:complete len:178 (+) Transcript_17443:131-664(+)
MEAAGTVVEAGISLGLAVVAAAVVVAVVALSAASHAVFASSAFVGNGKPNVDALLMMGPHAWAFSVFITHNNAVVCLHAIPIRLASSVWPAPTAVRSSSNGPHASPQVSRHVGAMVTNTTTFLNPGHAAPAAVPTKLSAANANTLREAMAGVPGPAAAGRERGLARDASGVAREHDF